MLRVSTHMIAQMNHPDLQFHFIPAMYVDPRSQVLKGSNLANSDMAKLGVSRYGQYGISYAHYFLIS